MNTVECIISPLLPIIVGNIAHVFPTEMELKPDSETGEIQRKHGLTRTGIVLQVCGDEIHTNNTIYKIIEK